MKVSFFSLVFCCWATIIYGQNMVLNPDFESYHTCPSNEGNFYLDNWYEVGGSCDFFHACNTSSNPFFVDVPENFAGYQLPNSGEGYAGIGAYAYEPINPDQISIREYFAGDLTEPLTIGNTYYVSVMVNLSNHSSNAVNNIGFKFITEDLLDGPIFDNPVMNNIAHVHTDEIITDTLNWVMISGTFIADANYPYLAIGNFFDDANTDSIYIQEPIQIGNEFAYSAYYYFDDVCVSTESGFCFPISSSVESLSGELANIVLSPNPVNQKLNLKNIEAVHQIKVMDLMGRVHLDLPRQDQIDVEELPIGIYFIKFKGTKNESTKTLKFIKQ